MESIANDIIPICIEFGLGNDKILNNNSLVEEIRKELMQGMIVVLKKVFPEKEMTEFRNEVIKWGKENDLFAHGESPSKYPDLNYHRIDDGSIPSACPHLFHQYGFNNINKINIEARVLFDKVAEKLLLIQNAVANTSYPISVEGLRLKVLQYPEGGGFLTEHTHPKDPQQIGLILSLSKKGRDFEEGAAAFKTPKGNVNTVDYHDMGDVVLFRYDLPHSVTPVNPGKKFIDWTLNTGKWSVVLELRETHGLSHKK